MLDAVCPLRFGRSSLPGFAERAERQQPFWFKRIRGSKPLETDSGLWPRSRALLPTLYGPRLRIAWPRLLQSCAKVHWCDPQTQPELDQYPRYAALFRSDGEAMCLALAEQRHRVNATDDRRAIRVAQQVGIPVLSWPTLVKAWADVTGPDQATLNRVLRDIQVLAQFKPHPAMPEYRWWMDELAKTGP